MRTDVEWQIHRQVLSIATNKETDDVQVSMSAENAYLLVAIRSLERAFTGFQDKSLKTAASPQGSSLTLTLSTGMNLLPDDLISHFG